MPITHWPRDDRPREKLLTKGEHILSDAELIALFLQTGLPGKTALDIARELLLQYGSLKKLLRTPMAVLIQHPGVGPAKYARLKAAMELARRYSCVDLGTGMVLNNSSLTRQFLTGKLGEQDKEVFACLFLNNHFQLLAYEELFYGTINETNIYPREIVKRGLAHNAAKIILAHNHPSGSPAPSEADKEVTVLIKQSLALIDITVADHIIIASQGSFSFADHGLL